MLKSQQNIDKLHPADHTAQSSGIHPRYSRWYNIHKSINIIHHINKRKDENHMIISIDAEKAFDKVQHPFMIKNIQQSGKRGTIPQHNKGHV